MVATSFPLHLKHVPPALSEPNLGQQIEVQVQYKVQYRYSTSTSYIWNMYHTIRLQYKLQLKYSTSTRTFAACTTGPIWVNCSTSTAKVLYVHVQRQAHLELVPPTQPYLGHGLSFPFPANPNFQFSNSEANLNFLNIQSPVYNHVSTNCLVKLDFWLGN